jgi:peroxiredoxin
VAYDKYQDEKFVVLSVSVQEDNAAIENFIARYGLEYPFLLDSDGNISSSYKVFSTPTTYFVDPDGVIIDILPGLMSEQWLDRNMASIEG